MTYNVTWYLISSALWHYDNDRTSAWLGETSKNRCTSQSLPRDLIARLEQLEGFLTAGTVLIVKVQATGSGCEWVDAIATCQLNILNCALVQNKNYTPED